MRHNNAIIAYNTKVSELFGDFACLNEILDSNRRFPDDYIPRAETDCGDSFSSKHKGVNFDKSRQKWGAVRHKDGFRLRLGRFKTEQEAIDALETFESSGSSVVSKPVIADSDPFSFCQNRGPLEHPRIYIFFLTGGP